MRKWVAIVLTVAVLSFLWTAAWTMQQPTQVAMSRQQMIESLGCVKLVELTVLRADGKEVELYECVVPLWERR